ncbi:27406_t:CDS:2 [Gigaspora margarita]|uniref:27406_t:CDS:1 n=1 Tax=Gigaspora margarita TaxID=4874 RepID=A0ABN7UIM7_GIGMA|nr:27406_t:CDS:2 [Gigaspora margarita]
MKKSSILKKGFENILKDDDIIKLEYSLCENIQKIGKGGFSTVYSAVYNGEMVALKRLDSEEETKEVSKEFIKELKQLLAIKSHPNINQCRGITQENNVHNDDDLTKTLLKEASVLKPRRPTTKTSNESSGRRFRELSLSNFFMKDKAHIDSDVKRIETSELSEPLDNKYTLEKLKEDQESVEVYPPFVLCNTLLISIRFIINKGVLKKLQEDVQREANRCHINWIQGVIKKYNLQEIPYLENKKRLVRGGFGTVYRARSSLLGGYVAIKVVESDTDEKAQKLFENELKQHSRINHERIIKFYGISLAHPQTGVWKFFSRGQHKDVGYWEGACDYCRTFYPCAKP